MHPSQSISPFLSNRPILRNSLFFYNITNRFLSLSFSSLGTRTAHFLSFLLSSLFFRPHFFFSIPLSETASRFSQSDLHAPPNLFFISSSLTIFLRQGCHSLTLYSSLFLSLSLTLFKTQWFISISSYPLGSFVSKTGTDSLSNFFSLLLPFTYSC